MLRLLGLGTRSRLVRAKRDSRPRQFSSSSLPAPIRPTILSSHLVRPMPRKEKTP